MITYQIKANTADVSVVIRIIDSTDGTPETGVVYNTSGIDLQYRREGATSTAITEATLAGLDSAHSDGGFLHIGNGYYRLDLPDAACAAGVTGVLVHGTVTGMVVIGCYIQLVAYDPFDTVRLGLTAFPNVASGNAGAVLTSGTGTAQLSVTSGVASANTTQIAGSSTAATQLSAGAVSTVTGTTSGTPTTTSIPASDLPSAVDDNYVGRVIIFTSGTLAGQATRITDYVGSTKTMTVVATTSAVAAGVTFTMV